MTDTPATETMKKPQWRAAMHALFALRAVGESRQDRSIPLDALYKHLGRVLAVADTTGKLFAKQPCAADPYGAEWLQKELIKTQADFIRAQEEAESANDTMVRFHERLRKAEKRTKVLQDALQQIKDMKPMEPTAPSRDDAVRSLDRAVLTAEAALGK